MYGQSRRPRAGPARRATAWCDRSEEHLPGDAAVNFSSIVVDEVTLVGSRCGSIPAALRLLAKGVVDVKSLIEARYALRDAEEALAEADQPGKMKVLLRA